MPYKPKVQNGSEQVHGSRARYRKGCRCRPCRDAEASYQRWHRRHKWDHRVVSIRRVTPPAYGGGMQPTDYRELVTVGLLVDVIDVFTRHGIEWADTDPRRRAGALSALVRFADAMAGDIDDDAF